MNRLVAHSASKQEKVSERKDRSEFGKEILGF